MKKITGLLLLTLPIIIALTTNDRRGLAALKANAGLVLHLEIIETQGGFMDETGVLEWAALGLVKKVYKGKQQSGDHIAVRFDQFEFLKDSEAQLILEPMPLEKGKSYILFLENKSESKARFHFIEGMQISYPLVDRFLGLHQYSPYLDYYIESLD